MDFAMDAGALADLLGNVKSVVPSRSTMPVLQHFLVEAKDGRVSVRGSSIDREVADSSPADVRVEGRSTIHADMLFGLAKRLPKAAVVTVAVDGDIATVSSGAATYRVRTLPADHFPLASEPRESRTASISAIDLAQLLSSTVPATRPGAATLWARGVYLHVVEGAETRLVSVGLDGHRLAYREVAVSDEWRGIRGVSIPSEAANQIITMMDDTTDAVAVTVSDARLIVRCGTGEVSTAVIDCEFPDYTRFMPRPNGALVTVRAQPLIDAVERAIVVLETEKDKTPSVGIAPRPSGLSVSAGKRGFEVAGETVVAAFHEDGEEMDVSAKYLTDMLRLWPDGTDVEIQQAGPGQPILFWSHSVPAYRQVIMPMKRE